MLALYRSGRQAEGLEVYRRTRTLLTDELGLEPGVELQELERAILVQDPALDRAVDEPARRDHGRCAASARSRGSHRSRPRTRSSSSAASAWSRSSSRRLADRRCWRSSARRAAASRRSCAPACCPRSEHAALSYARPTEPRSASSRAAIETWCRRGERLVVAVDQLEELFAAAIDRGGARGLSSTRSWTPPGTRASRRARVALRADFFGRLAAYLELADLVGPNHVLLGPLTTARTAPRDRGARRTGRSRGRAGAGRRTRRRRRRRGRRAAAALDGAGRPLACAREADSLTLAAYERTGGVRGAVGRHAEAAFERFDERGRQVGAAHPAAARRRRCRRDAPSPVGV